MPEHIRVELDFIPVEERLPGSTQSPVLFIQHGIMRHGWYSPYRDEQVRFVRDGDVIPSVTHWAEIPRLEEA